MAARSRAIQSRLERLAPSIEELYIAGIVTADERNEIARTRMGHEYKLVARPLLLVDVTRAIDYELALDDKIAAFNSKHKLQLKHRWACLDRVEQIYRVSVPRLEGDEQRSLEDDYLGFLRRTGRAAVLSRYLAERLAQLPREPRYYCLSAEWEAEQNNTDLARAIAQRGVEAVPQSPEVWAAAVYVEVDFVAKALGRIRDDGANAGAKADALRAENEALGQVLLDLALGGAVLEAALQSKAAQHGLLPMLAATICAKPFTRPLAAQLAQAAVAHAAAPGGALDALKCVSKIGARWIRLTTPSAFIEEKAEPVPKGAAAALLSFVALDELARRVPQARPSAARAVLDLFGAAGDARDEVRVLCEVRFVSGQWEDAALDVLRAAAAKGVTDKDVAVATTALLDMLGLPPGDDRAASQPQHAPVDVATRRALAAAGLIGGSTGSLADAEKLIADGQLDKADAALAGRRAEEPSDWALFRLRALLAAAGGSGRKRRDRDAADSSTSDDDSADAEDAEVAKRTASQVSARAAKGRNVTDGAAAAVREGLLFIARCHLKTTSKVDHATLSDGTVELASVGVRCAVAAATRTEVARVTSPVRRDAADHWSVTACSAILDHAERLLEAVSALPAHTGAASALRQHVLPLLLGVAQSRAADGSQHLKQRTFGAVRKAYERAAKDDKSVAAEYASFEAEIARRPELAAAVRRNFGAAAMRR